MGANVAKEALSNIASEHIPGLSTFHCAMLGLDFSGKTTVLYRLKFNQYMNAAPTIGFNCEKVRTNFGSSFTVWDVGGQDKLRPLWRSYTRCTDGIIFVVDSTKEDRLEEAKLELQKICRCHHSAAGVHAARSPVPVLVLANKQDLPAAIDANKLEAFLGLRDLVGGNNNPHSHHSRQWHLQPTCAITGEGLDEGMEKLQEMILSSRRRARSSRPPGAKGGRSVTRNKVRRSHSHHF